MNFPEIYQIPKYPEETFYSYISRLYRYLGSPKITNFNRTFFGSSRINYNPLIPIRLEDFSSKRNVPALETIIKDMTIIPFYTNFLLDQDLEKLTKDISKNGQNFSSILRLNVSNFTKERLIYCPECAKEDIEKYGECYLHRNHYFPGINICPVHSIKLKEFKVPESNLFKIPIVLKPQDFDVISGSNIEIRLAEIAQELFEKPIFSSDLIRKKLKSKLQERDFIKGSKIFYRQINTKLIERYGIEFLEKYQLNDLTSKKTRNWVSSIINSASKLDPFRILVLIDFLFDNFDSFLNFNDSSNKRNNTITHTCINKICPNFQEDNFIRVNRVEDGINNSRDIIRCDKCGMIYSIKKEKAVILQYGNLWDQELRELKSKGHPNNKIADILGISSSAIPKHLKRKDHSEIDHKVNQARKCLDKCGKITKTEFQRNFRKEYRNLKSYDWAYLDAFSFREKEEMEFRKKNETNDWADFDLLEEIKEAHKNILNIYPSIRINRINILKECGFKRSKNLQDFPLSKDYLENIIESTEEYYIRYGIASINHLKSIGIDNITRSKLSMLMNDKRRLYDENIWSQIKNHL